MNFKKVIKERFVFLMINGMAFLFLAILLYFARVKGLVIIGIFLIWFVPLFLSYLIDYLTKKNFYNETVASLEGLDKKYLLPELLEEPHFQEGKIFYHVLQETDKGMHEEVNTYQQKQTEYREYIEAWVHEIKTPIASSKLIIENNKNQVAVGIAEELSSIEALVEQALYYARSTSVNKDYLIKEFLLHDCISKVLKKNARSFIYKKIQLQYKEVTEVVYSDKKWIEFILNQIIGNAINYSLKEKKEIKIYSTTNENSIVLHIIDTGIGIDVKDLPRIFEKGFTGENGRIYRKSTGMGLYLCKQLADKLHLGLSIQSAKNEGTEVQIIFPKSKVMLLES